MTIVYQEKKYTSERVEAYKTPLLILIHCKSAIPYVYILLQKEHTNLGLEHIV